MVVAAKFDHGDDYLVEMIELNKNLHPYFVATQSHPEFLSRPNKPHPLFCGLIKACGVVYSQSDLLVQHLYFSFCQKN
ncbi:hypothetical protein HC864_03350 [Candidatus Gracilibacteria bacterium]|nr:hypothetical protein [Candidatus Gracilibacteria bacterium]